MNYAVIHAVLDRPVDPATLEDGSWNDQEYDLPPPSGKITNGSLETILERVHKLL